MTEIEGEIERDGRNVVAQRSGYVRKAASVNRIWTGTGWLSVAVKDSKAYFRNKFVVTEDFDEEERTGKYIKSSIFTADPDRLRLGKIV